MTDKLILFDIDYTLFDVAKYRELVFAKLQELLPEIPDVPGLAIQAYDEMRTRGPFDPVIFTEQLYSNIPIPIEKQIAESLWWDEDILVESLYPETMEVIDTLSQQTGVSMGIFSSGVEKLQLGKIRKIAQYFATEHIHIDVMKDEKLPEILAKNKNKNVILIDDYIPVIEKAKQANNAVTAIWIKRGRLAAKFAPSDEFPPDYIIENLRELLPIIPAI